MQIGYRQDYGQFLSGSSQRSVQARPLKINETVVAFFPVIMMQMSNLLATAKFLVFTYFL